MNQQLSDARFNIGVLASDQRYLAKRFKSLDAMVKHYIAQSLQDFERIARLHPLQAHEIRLQDLQDNPKISVSILRNWKNAQSVASYKVMYESQYRESALMVRLCRHLLRRKSMAQIYSFISHVRMHLTKLDQSYNKLMTQLGMTPQESISLVLPISAEEITMPQVPTLYRLLACAMANPTVMRPMDQMPLLRGFEEFAQEQRLTFIASSISDTTDSRFYRVRSEDLDAANQAGFENTEPLQSSDSRQITLSQISFE